MPFNEHRQSMQINVFDGYAIYSIKDNTAVKAEPVSVDDATSTDEKSLTPATFTFGGTGNG